MSERWARVILGAYGVAGAAAYPLIGPYVSWRARQGKEDRARRGERYGRPSRPRPVGPLIWVHAASVGETNAVAPLVHELLNSEINVVLTTGTVASANVATRVFGDTVTHQYVPLDLRPAVRRFLGHWDPDLAVFVESEVWPMTILELNAHRIPQVLINGRLSDRSFAAWQRRPHLAEVLFEKFAHVVAQSDEDGDRFQMLGARPVTVSGNLKADAVPPGVDERALAMLSAQLQGRPVWAAISTHPGEEKLAAEVHMILRDRHPGLLTIIVPRHPDRSSRIVSELAEMQLTVARRTTGEAIPQSADILLGDTIGEIGLYLRLSEIAFLGRSLTAQGGQNPLEPAMLGTAILSGRNVQNFRESYQKLIRAGGARLVRDRDMLAGAVHHLLKHDDVRRTMIGSAADAVEQMRGALQRTLKALDPFIHPLVVKARLERAEARDPEGA
jgi:3-deoxy-D-manno-octulosonic-acid transferase